MTSRRQPFEWIVALRFLREGRMQTLFIVVGIAIGVAVIVFMSALLSGLQTNFIRRVLTAQPHIQLLPPKDVARPLGAVVGLVGGVSSLEVKVKDIYAAEAIAQRVAVARSLAMDPPLLLADEPTGNIDTKAADAVFDLLRNANRERGMAIVFVTHNPALAGRCDRTVQVVDGMIRA